MLGRLIPEITQSLAPMTDVKRAHSPEANGHDGAIVKRQRVEDGALTQSSKAKAEVSQPHTPVLCLSFNLRKELNVLQSRHVMY